MNEQIDQLMVKAGAYFGGDGVVYDNFDPKKFAELIVKECADWIDRQDESRCPYGIDLLEHFGVE
jgi:hypothetical protein